MIIPSIYFQRLPLFARSSIGLHNVLWYKFYKQLFSNNLAGESCSTIIPDQQEEELETNTETWQLNIVYFMKIMKLREYHKPWSSSKTIWLSRTDIIWWATVITVDLTNCCLIDANALTFPKIKKMLFNCSLDYTVVALSTEAVASSKTKILLSFRITLPKHISWHWPMLQFSPFSATVFIDWKIRYIKHVV